MKTKRLTTKVAISTMASVAVMIAIIYLAYLSQKDFEKTIVSQTQQQLLSTAKSTAHALEDYLQRIQRDLEGSAGISEIQAVAQKSILYQPEDNEYCHFDAIFERFDARIDSLYLLDTNAIILDRMPFKKEKIGENYLERPGIKDFLRDPKPTVTELFVTKTSKEVAASILYPVYAEGEFVGLLRVVLYMKNLYKHFIEPIRVGKKGYAWVLDDDGTIAMHPKPEHMGKDIMAPRKEKFPDYDWSELENVVAKMTKGEEGVGLYHSASWTESKPEKVKRFVSYAPIHIGNKLWSIGVSMDYSEIIGPINRQARNAFGLAGLVILLFGAGGVLLLRAEKRKADLKAEGRHLQQIVESAEALRESEEKYRTILESIEDGYFEVDIRGNFTFFNDSLCKIHGYSKHKLMGMNNRQYMDEETAKKIYQTFNKVYTTGEPARGFEWEIIRKDGTKRYVQSSVSLIKDAEGQRTGFRGIVRDVTERKQMEMELIQTKNFLQNILDSSIDGITTTDLQGNVIYTSPRTKDILGYGKEKVIGKKAYPFYGNGKEDAKAIMKELKAKGELRDHEMKFIRKDGELIDINLSASLLKDEKGEVIGTLGIYRDITEKNILEAQLAQAQRMEALATLAGGIAHNFNNLLMSIQGNASLMLLDKTSPDPDHERLRNIEKSVQNGSRVTRQLLGYAREGRYEVRPISLNQLVEETSDTFGTTKKEITVHQEFAKDLYGIKADQGQIEQILLNLYVNASDAMPGGGDLILKTMNVTHKDMRGKAYKAKPGDYVLLTVRDTGIGMDKKTQERIFDPFFTTKGLAKGTGLGLASVYGIVKAHGGYIDVNSKKGHGTTFSIYLPASEGKIEKPAKSAGHIIEGAGTVLLVDDEEMVLDVGAQLLKTLGYTVLEAKGGREAIEIYREKQR